MDILGTEKRPDYYNSKLSGVIRPLETSPWRDLYEAAASLLSPQGHAVIADIGCGTGRFARLLCDRGYTQYWGVDFSDARICEARTYVPEFQFSVGNIFDTWVKEKFRKFNTFVLLENLEHIDDDLTLLSTIPSGSRVIFSVPNYDSEAHVRFFNNAEEVIKRYSSLLDFSYERSTIMNKKRRERMIFLFGCIKK